jgi:hypothetical protein
MRMVNLLKNKRSRLPMENLHQKNLKGKAFISLSLSHLFCVTPSIVKALGIVLCTMKYPPKCKPRLYAYLLFQYCPYTDV